MILHQVAHVGVIAMIFNLKKNDNLMFRIDNIINVNNVFILVMSF